MSPDPAAASVTTTASLSSARFVHRRPLAEATGPSFMGYLSRFKEDAQAVQALVTAGALIVGGTWTYRQFIQHRENFPRARIEHAVSQLVVDNDKTLLHLVVHVSNTGTRLLRIDKGWVQVQQVLPALPTVWNSIDRNNPVVRGDAWPRLAYAGLLAPEIKIQIEPGHIEDLDYDFFIPSDLKVVRLFTWISDQEDPDGMGWVGVAIHDLANERRETDENCHPASHNRVGPIRHLQVELR